MKFEHISVEHGLSQSTITAILQDHRGFMWFGAEEGLNKYDGYRFTTYRHDPDDPTSLSSDHILALFEDSTGVLWVGTQGGGLNRFDRDAGQFMHYLHDPEDPRSLGDEANEVWSIYEGRDGVMWVGTGTGLERFDRETMSFVQYRTVITNPYGREANPVFAIYEDDAGKIWIGAWNGLHSWDRASVRFEHYWPDPGAQNEGHNIVQTIVPDGKGGLWLGTAGSGFYRFDLETEHFSQYLLNPSDVAGYAYNDVKALQLDEKGDLWLGTDGGGLYHFDTATGQLTQYQSDPKDSYSLSSNYINRIYRDASGVFWIGAWGGGVNKLVRTSEQFAHYQHDPNNPNSLIHNRVLALAEDHLGDVWIGTDGGGLDRWDRKNGVFTHFQHDPDDPNSLSGNYVGVVYEDREQRLWIAAWGAGLNLWDRETGGFSHYHNVPEDPYSLSSDYILSILQDHTGVLWVGASANGLNRFDPNSETVRRYGHNPLDLSSLSDNTVSALLEDHQGGLWVGTGDGLNRYDRDNDHFIRYPLTVEPAIEAANRAVTGLFEDRSGLIWMTTNGGGLIKFDPVSETMTAYTEVDGLADDAVQSILEDRKGYLWLGTHHGLSRFDPAAELFKNYGVGDGLQSYEFSYGAACSSRSGEMFFGGVNGFNAFYPSLIHDNLNAPPVVLTAITQGNEGIDTEAALENVQRISLNWPNNFFEFEFAALNYDQPERNQYAYMLEGFDEDWHYVGRRRFGQYTNLPGGSYTLRLKASNNDGVWNEVGTSVEIVVAPPFWQTNWFRAAIGLALALALVLGYRQRVRGIQARSAELEAQVEARTREIEQRRQELEALFRADEELYAHLELDHVLQALADIAIDVLKADKSAVLIWDEDRERLATRVARGFSQRSVETLTFARGEGVAGYVASTGAPLVLENAIDNEWRQSERPDAVKAVLDEGIESLMLLPIVTKKEVIGVFNVSFTSRHVFHEDELRLFSALAQRAGAAIENAQRFNEEQRRAEQFRAISEAGSRITAILAIDELLDQIVHLVVEMPGYDHAGIGLIEGDEVVFKAGAGKFWERPWTEPRRMRVGVEGVTGWVASSGQPLLIPDISRDSRYTPLPGDVKPRAELAVPILVQDNVIGVLDVESEHAKALDQSDVVVLQSLAHQVAAAIENTRLYAQAQQVAVLEERSRLARDLHDAVTQTLFSASLLAEVLPETWETDQEEGRQLLKELRQLSRGALAEMRTLLLELRPAVLLEANIADLLKQLAEAVTGRSGLPVHVAVEGYCDPPDDVHVALYRIAQEALNNAIKHAQASRVDIELRGEATGAGQHIQLGICDDGRGFAPDDILPDRLGLGIIRERAQAIGAQLTVSSQPGAGTRIAITWEG